MAQLMELLNERRGDMSYERFAQQHLDMSGSTLWRYDQGKADIGLDALQRMARRFLENKDAIMLGAIVAYAISLKAEMAELEQIGNCLLTVSKEPIPSR